MTKIIKIIITLGALLLAGIIFYLMLRSFSWQEIYALIKVLKWTTIAIFITAVLVISFIKATRFFIILKSGGIQLPFFKIVITFLASQALTPLPGGEIGRAILFKNKLHLQMKQVAAPVFLQAVTELWTAAFLTMVSSFFIKTSFGIWFALGLLVLLIVLSVAILIPKKLKDGLSFLKNKGLKYKWIDELEQTLDATRQLIVKENGGLHWRLWISIIMLGIGSHSVAAGLMWYIAGLQGVNLSIFQSVFAAGIAVLIQSILFIIPGGLGVTEGGVIGVLASYGIPWKKAVIITLLYRTVMLPLLIIIALIFLFFLYVPKILKFNHKYV